MTEIFDFLNVSAMKKVPKQTLYLYIFLFSIIFLAFFLYVLIIYSPSGTDVYSHMVNTNRMSESNSLTEFYQKSLIEEYEGYDYPFGLWYFGSIIIKITGLDIYTIVSVIPFIIMIGTLLIFYCYSNELLQSKDGSLLSLIFLISMPYVSLLLLNYSGAVFCLAFLIGVFYLCLKNINLTNLLLMLILVVTLCFSHTGTFVFLTFTALVYFVFRALIWKKFDINYFILLVMIIFTYNTTVQFFPAIQPHYVDKGYLIITTSESIANAVHVDMIRQLGQIFFDTIFVTNNYAYAILWAGLIFFIGAICVIIRTKAGEFFKGHAFFAGLPIIGDITNVSHGIALAPFWLGPIQTLLACIGFFKIDQRGQCLALTLLITAALPGSLQGSEGTGSLREISFILLIIPILAAAGFLYLIPRINSFSEKPLKRSLGILLCLCIIVPLIVAPVVGRLYYEPGLTMSQEEENNLKWLSTVGTSLEGASGAGYRERMTLYADKKVPSIPSGSDYKRASTDLSNTFFSVNGESYTFDLSSYGIQYLIASDRVFKGSTFDYKTALVIDRNKMADKIDSSSNFFGIYKILSVPSAKRVATSEPVYIELASSNTSIQDVGSAFIFENDYYKIKLSDAAPVVRYFGTKTHDRMGEGYFNDNIIVRYTRVSSDTQASASYDLSDLWYSNVTISANEIIYKTRIYSDNNTYYLGTMSVKYVFSEKVVKREITLANDKADQDRGWDVNVLLTSTFFMPMQYFDYHAVGPEKPAWIHKIIYPAQDSVILDNDKFDQLYFNDGTTGLFVSYGDSLPYPHRLTYRGSPYYDYGRVTIRSEMALQPSEPGTLVQYFSVNNKEDAIRNIEESTSVSRYDYPNAIIPMILTGQTSNAARTAYETNFFTALQNRGLSYTLAVPPSLGARINQLKNSGINPSGYVSLKDAVNVSNEIQSLTTNYNVNGVIFSSFNNNFDAIKLLQDNDMSYAGALTTESPSDEYYQEGVRNLKFAYYDGERTGVVFIPTTLPLSTRLNLNYDENSILWQWNETIKSVADIGGVAMFQWNPDDAGNPAFLDHLMGLLDYAQSRGMTITTPDVVASHYQKLQNVYATVTKNEDSVILNVQNTNTDPIGGVTYRLVLPSIDDTCPFTITGGTISRHEIKNNECIVYASADLEAGETKEIQVNSPSVKKQFRYEIPPLVHGENEIKLTDENGLPLKGASLILDTKYYESDRTGIVKFPASHGIHTLQIEKAGYYPVRMQVEVKARYYRVVNWLNGIF